MCTRACYFFHALHRSTFTVQLYFFYCCGHHLDLHSFPTRRSSDLILLGNNPGDIPRGLKLTEQPHAPEVPVGLPSSRSEEHTSELQSPYDLVCRLLLEKKNWLMADRAVGVVAAVLLIWFCANDAVA